MTSKQRQQPATDKQYGFLTRLMDERELDPTSKGRLAVRIAARSFTKGEASDSISFLLKQAKVSEFRANGIPQVRGGSTDKPKVETPGMFRCEDEVYVVAKSRNGSGRVYAKRLVELRDGQGDRLTDAEGHVRFDFEYERGAIFKLDESMRLSQSEARELAVRYGKCAMCGRRLKVAASVERGYGPVCWSRFTPDSSEVTA